jgi:hypothetical protein
MPDTDRQCRASAANSKVSKVMEEKVFFNQQNVSVSNSRFISHGQTYAMSGITSVKSFRQDPSRTAAVILGVIGVCVMLAGFSSGIGLTLFGATAVGIAVLWWKSLKSEFSVILSSASGEVKPLSSTDEAFISNVLNALNDAIVHRG